MANEAYFQQIVQNINSLVADKRFNDAYKLCIRHLEENTDSKELREAKERIEQLVEEENKKIMKERIEEVKLLIKDGKYRDALVKVKPIFKLAPNDDKLKKLIMQAQEKYKEQVEKLEIEFENKQSERLTKILNEDPETLINELFDLERSNPGNPDVMRLVAEFRDKLIEKKINQKRELLASGKYADIMNLISQLKIIDPKNSRIAKLENDEKIKQHNKQKAGQKEFEYEGSIHLETLMKLEKYDEAMRVAMEILAVSKENKEVSKTLKKAEKKAYQTNRGIVIQILNQEIPKTKTEFKASKGDYIEI